MAERVLVHQGTGPFDFLDLGRGWSEGEAARDRPGGRMSVQLVQCWRNWGQGSGILGATWELNCHRKVFTSQEVHEDRCVRTTSRIHCVLSPLLFTKGENDSLQMPVVCTQTSSYVYHKDMSSWF